MEVEDELINELSMSILEPGAVIPTGAEGVEGEEFQEVGDVTITVNTRGEVVEVDQDSLNTVLASGQQSARVTFVRVDDGGQSTIETQIQINTQELLADYGQTDGGAEADVNMGDMVLNPDQLKSLEKVLESDEAKNLLNVEDAEDKVEAKTESQTESQTPTRRSQRQVDRETRQTAEKIRAENQESMRREGAGDTAARGRGKGGMMRGGSRPSRSRKHPRTAKTGEETSLETKETGESEAEGKKEDEDNQEDEDEEEEEENEDDSDSGSWVSEDDPDRLWCICQKPHNNRFMICCDTCLDWFHGICVGITKAQGKEMEMAGKDWKCPECLQGIKRGSAQTAGVNKVDGKESAPAPVTPAVPTDDIDELLNDDLEDEFLGSPNKADSTETQKLRRKSSSLLEEPEKKREKSRPHKTPQPSTKVSSGKTLPSSNSGKEKEKSGPKIIPAHRVFADKKAQKMEDIIKKRPVKSREEMVAETKAALRRSVSSQDSIKSSKRERRSSESSDRRPTPVKRKTAERPVTDYEVKEPKTDNTNLRFDYIY